MSCTVTASRLFPTAEDGGPVRAEFPYVLAGRAAEYPGTISAIHEVSYEGRPALLKVFSAHWSRHTLDFCRWAFEETFLSDERIASVARAFHIHLERLADYGLAVVPPREIWSIRMVNICP